jgi:hypothetical protein
MWQKTEIILLSSVISPTSNEYYKVTVYQLDVGKDSQCLHSES